MLDPELFLIQRKLKYLKEDMATERYNVDDNNN